MKIAFINPPFLDNFSRGQRSPAVTKGGTLYYPYWLAYSAAWAEKNGFEVNLFDFIARKSTFSQSFSVVEEFRPDIIVIETSTPSIFNDIDYAKGLKKVLPKAFIVMVGTHVSALPEWTLKQSKSINAVVVGEYDQAVVDLAKNLSKGKVERIVRGGTLDLDRLPFVAEIYKKFLNPKDYFFSAADFPMVMIITGRGCPFGCFYCVYPQTMHGLKYRFTSPEKVAAEFRYIKENLPEVKEVIIEDDTFTADIKRTREICQLLIQEKNKLKWSTNARVHLDLETIKLMKKAGCRLLIVGYESGSQEVLDGMGKKIKLSQSLEFSKNSKKAGMLVHGCFMVGNPGETKETMKETLEFAKKLAPDSAQFYPLFAYPGTKAYSWAVKNKYLKTQNFRDWLKEGGAHQCLVDLPNLTAKEMEDFCNKAYFQFHLRPHYLLKKLGQLFTNPEEGIRSLRSGIKFFVNQK